MEQLASIMGQVDMSEDTCDKHEVQVNGQIVKKQIKLVRLGDKYICPLCASEERTKQLEQETSEKLKQLEAERKHRMFYDESVITDIGLLEASFGNYDVHDPEEIANKERAQKAFMQYRDGNTFNTWLTGSPGVGKSHLSMAILRNLNEVGDKNRSCLFVSVDEMLLRIRNSFDDRESKYTESYFIKQLTEADFVVLDDLGAETGGTGTEKKATDFTLRVLYAIANGRRNKSTIITTNLSNHELSNMYDPKLVSRMLGDMYLINFEKTKDKRINKLEF